MARIPRYAAQQGLDVGSTPRVRADNSVSQALGNAVNAGLQREARIDAEQEAAAKRLEAKRKQREAWDRARNFENMVADTRQNTQQMFRDAAPGDTEVATRASAYREQQTQAFLESLGDDEDAVAQYQVQIARLTNEAARRTATAQLALDDNYYATGIKEVSDKLIASVLRGPDDAEHALTAINGVIDKSGLSTSQKAAEKTRYAGLVAEAEADGLVYSGRADEARKAAEGDAELLNRIDTEEQKYNTGQRIAATQRSQAHQGDVALAIQNGDPKVTAETINADPVLSSIDKKQLLGQLEARRKKQEDQRRAWAKFGDVNSQFVASPHRREDQKDFGEFIDFVLEGSNPVDDPAARTVVIAAADKHRMVSESTIENLNAAINSGDPRAAERALDLASHLEDVHPEDNMFVNTAITGSKNLADMVTHYQGNLDTGMPAVGAQVQADGTIDAKAPMSAAQQTVMAFDPTELARRNISREDIKVKVEAFDAEDALSEAFGSGFIGWFMGTSTDMEYTPQQASALTHVATRIYEQELFNAHGQESVAAARTHNRLKTDYGVTNVASTGRVSPAPIEKAYPYLFGPDANPRVMELLQEDLAEIANKATGNPTPEAEPPRKGARGRTRTGTVHAPTYRPGDVHLVATPQTMAALRTSATPSRTPEGRRPKQDRVGAQPKWELWVKDKDTSEKVRLYGPTGLGFGISQEHADRLRGQVQAETEAAHEKAIKEQTEFRKSQAKKYEVYKQMRREGAKGPLTIWLDLLDAAVEAEGPERAVARQALRNFGLVEATKSDPVSGVAQKFQNRLRNKAMGREVDDIAEEVDDAMSTLKFRGRP